MEIRPIALSQYETRLYVHEVKREEAGQIQQYSYYRPGTFPAVFDDGDRYATNFKTWIVIWLLLFIVRVVAQIGMLRYQ
jgi:hypothetical protein